jgi:hypothetical protein
MHMMIIDNSRLEIRLFYRQAMNNESIIDRCREYPWVIFEAVRTTKQWPGDKKISIN